MTAQLAIDCESVEQVVMATKAQVMEIGGRIVQIEVIPTGECMEEVYYCECISHDFLSHARPVDYLIKERVISFICDSGVFSFFVECDEDSLPKLAKQVNSKQFYFQKKGSGFSLNI